MTPRAHLRPYRTGLDKLHNILVDVVIPNNYKQQPKPLELKAKQVISSVVHQKLNRINCHDFNIVTHSSIT